MMTPFVCLFLKRYEFPEPWQKKILPDSHCNFLLENLSYVTYDRATLSLDYNSGNLLHFPFIYPCLRTKSKCWFKHREYQTCACLFFLLLLFSWKSLSGYPKDLNLISNILTIVISFGKNMLLRIYYILGNRN